MPCKIEDEIALQFSSVPTLIKMNQIPGPAIEVL